MPAPVSALAPEAVAPAVVAPDASSPSAVLPAQLEFAFVKFGQHDGSGFTEAVDNGGPALIAEVWSDDEWPEALTATIEGVRGFVTGQDPLDPQAQHQAAVLADIEPAARPHGTDRRSSPLMLSGAFAARANHVTLGRCDTGFERGAVWV